MKSKDKTLTIDWSVKDDELYGRVRPKSPEEQSIEELEFQEDFIDTNIPLTEREKKIDITGLIEMIHNGKEDQIRGAKTILAQHPDLKDGRKLVDLISGIIRRKEKKISFNLVRILQHCKTVEQVKFKAPPRMKMVADDKRRKEQVHYLQDNEKFTTASDKRLVYSIVRKDRNKQTKITFTLIMSPDQGDAVHSDKEIRLLEFGGNNPVDKSGTLKWNRVLGEYKGRIELLGDDAAKFITHPRKFYLVYD